MTECKFGVSPNGRVSSRTRPKFWVSLDLPRAPLNLDLFFLNSTQSSGKCITENNRKYNESSDHVTFAFKLRCVMVWDPHSHGLITIVVSR